MSKRLSKELKDLIVEDYLNGVTTREIIKKHKTYELYNILNERGIEYKQNNDKQNKKYDSVVELYLSGVPLKTIEELTGCKNIKMVLKKFNIERNRDPKEYNTHRKEERNQQLIADYLSREYSTKELSSKYKMSSNNIYRILRVYKLEAVKNRNHHWVIRQKVEKEPNIKCKFYILENYHGYTKIGITTQKSVEKRFTKNIKVFFELNNILGNCYDIESKAKSLLKEFRATKIDKTIDGWSECYDLSPQEVLDYVNSIIEEVISI
jgi:transposase-like protein